MTDISSINLELKTCLQISVISMISNIQGAPNNLSITGLFAEAGALPRRGAVARPRGTPDPGAGTPRSETGRCAWRLAAGDAPESLAGKHVDFTLSNWKNNWKNMRNWRCHTETIGKYSRIFSSKNVHWPSNGDFNIEMMMGHRSGLSCLKLMMGHYAWTSPMVLGG